MSIKYWLRTLLLLDQLNSVLKETGRLEYENYFRFKSVVSYSLALTSHKQFQWKIFCDFLSPDDQLTQIVNKLVYFRFGLFSFYL